jgi:hypothetical protein
MISKAVKKLENELLKLNNISYKSIDSLMRKIMKEYDVTAKELHYGFKDTHNKTPDNWIKEKMKNLKENEKQKSFVINPEISKKQRRSNLASKKLNTNVPKGEQEAAKNIAKKMGGTGAQLPPNFRKEEITLVQKILGEERCGKGMYWCNTDKECKPLAGMKVPGQKIQPKETGIGKPVAECSHTGKGEKCPVHGTHKCPSGDVTSESNVVRDANGNVYVEFIDLIKPGSIEEENPCWKGYTQIGMKTKNGKQVPNCVPLKKGVKQAKGYKKESVDEAVRIPSQTGNNLSVTLSWRGKYYNVQFFFPQVKMPTRAEITTEIQKIYPDSRVITYKVSDIKPGEPIVYAYKGGSGGKLGSNKNYVKPMGEEVEIVEIKK